MSNGELYARRRRIQIAGHMQTTADSVDELLLGDSPPMRELRRVVRKFGPPCLPVLILGPTGSGKGAVAHALHMSSGRKGRYVVANMAALGDGLLESELFGHVRGAFTNSVGARPGLLKHADGGTAFLDEIHRLSAHAQPKLLRTLETQLIRPVGSDHEVRGGFRVVAAANEDLEGLVNAGRFQADLLARIARLVIHVPALATHLDDVPVLAEQFLIGMSGHTYLGISPGALDALQQYDWPRNVRELQAVVERASVLAEGPWIDRCDIQAAIAHGWSAPSSAAQGVAPLRFDRDAERERQVLTALRANRGKVRLAADCLGVSRKTLYRWMSNLGIGTPERRRRSPSTSH